MRKTLLLIVLAVLSCNAVFAQDDQSGELEWNYDRSFRIAIGPKVGAGVAFGSDPTLYNLNFGSGFAYQGGLVVNAHFGRRYEQSQGGTGLFGIQAEAMYSVRTVSTGGSAKLNQKCIEIPVLVQIYPTSAIGIEAGVTMVKFLGCSPNQINFEDITIHTGEITGGDVMVTAGACYKMPFGLMIDLRYNLGMSNLAGNFDTKVSSFMASFTYLFNIVK